jgi:predicted MFS family arabinose efflux permease
MSALAPLRVAAFRRLVSTYGLNELGWGLVTLALAVLAYDRTGSPLAPTALFLASTFVPALVTPALVARIDLLPVRRSLGGLYAAEAALFALAALAIDRLPLGVIVAIALLDGVLALAGRSITRASVAATLEATGQLRAGNALLNIVFAVALTTGPAIGGAVVAGYGVSTSLAAGAVVFAVMALLAHTGRTLPAGEHERGDWLTRAKAGFAYARGNAVTQRLLLAQGATLVFCVLATPIEVVYARESLDGTTATYGLLLAAWGAGSILGSLVFARAGRVALAVVIPVALTTTATGFGVMAVAPSVGLALVGCVLGGFGNGMQVVAAIQSLQERVAAEFQARVMGLAESVNAAAVGFGFLLGGVIATLGSPRLVLGVAAVGVIALAPAFAAALREGAKRSRAPLAARPA